MKRTLLIVLLLIASTSAHSRNVGHGPSASSGHSSAGSQGGHYTLGDQFQPWPQTEMKQYAKPRFETYKGAPGDDHDRS